MKSYLLAAGLLLAAPAYAQKEKDALITLPIDNDTHQIAYTGIIEVPNAAKNELYARGKVWFANAFKSAQNVIQADDKEAGLLVGKGYSSTYIPSALIIMHEKVWYTVKLSFKDGKYRYVITDFQFQGEPNKYSLNPAAYAAETSCLDKKKDGTPTNMAAKFSKALDKEAQDMVASIQAGMSKPAAGSDW